MIGHDLRFVGTPSSPRQFYVTGFNKEVPFIGYNVFAAWQLKDKLPLSYLTANAVHLNASLLLELSDRSLFKGFTLFNAPAWGSPVILTRKRPDSVNKAKKQNSS